jgi:formate-dependent nitrite reductase membrane component NrfD
MRDNSISTNTWVAREQRLREIREEAERTGKVIARPDGDHDPSPVKASAETGYYGMPLLKRPQWTVEVPLYFFVGGLAGAASLIAGVGKLSSADARLIRQARWLAAIGGAISPALLISDLGVPSRFLHMLRVFKIQSPMSVGSWTLVAFSNSAAATAVLGEFEKRRSNHAISILTDASQIVSALTGMILASYTGVLIGATAIPAWNERVSTLPIHFAASGTAAAASILELSGNDSEALNRIALGAAAIETAMGASLEMSAKPATRDLRTGSAGWSMRGAGLLSGPLPLVLRLLALKRNSPRRKLRRAAAISSLAGSLLTRWAWIQAGKTSAEDSSVPLELQNCPDKTQALGLRGL